MTNQDYNNLKQVAKNISQNSDTLNELAFLNFYEWKDEDNTIQIINTIMEIADLYKLIFVIQTIDEQSMWFTLTPKQLPAPLEIIMEEEEEENWFEE